MNIVNIIIANVFVNNYVFSRFLGTCPFLGVSNKMETATGMGVAVTFVTTLASVITFIIQKLILETAHIEYLQTIVFILVIASLVQFVELVLKKTSPSLYNAMGVYLPLITTNCIVLGVAILNIQEKYNILETAASAFSAALGFSLALVLMASVREKLEIAEIHESLKGFPLTLIAAGLMSIAFAGFSGLM